MTLRRFSATFEHRYTGGQYQDELFRYRLFVPRSLQPTKRYPLLIWLHGFGEAGSDNLLSLRHIEYLAFKDFYHTNPEQYQFFILVVQTTKDNPMWFKQSGREEPDDILTVLVDILRKTMREYPIDPDRISVMGVSSGGNGCWELALRYPDLFASAVPISSRGGDESRADRLKNIPIWVFHNLDDQGTPMTGDEAMVAAVQAAGGNVHLTLPTHIPELGRHDAWTDAFESHDILGWMLAQRRGASICWTPPGCDPWKWWHILILPCALLVIVRVAGYIDQRRQRTSPIADHSEAEENETDFCIGPILPECGKVEGFENQQSRDEIRKEVRHD